MTLRKRALDALRRELADQDLVKHVGFGPTQVSKKRVSSRIVVSKVYRPDQSWTRRWSWWHQLPKAKLAGDRSLLLLCERRSEGFHLLVVPRPWLREHQDRLAWSEAQEKFNLFLSAQPEDQFVECRGAGLDFSPFFTCSVT